jgi:thiol peroxidase
MQEKKGAVTMKSQPLTLVGGDAAVGQSAPDFEVLGNDMSPVRLSQFRGKACLLISVPSLDTPVCDTEAGRFNREAAALGGVEVLVISMDLPFAQERWCGAAGAENVKTLSDHRDASFGKAFGVLIKELRLLARAVFAVDAEGVIRYKQVVPEITDQPDYEAALEAVKGL